MPSSYFGVKSLKIKDYCQNNGSAELKIEGGIMVKTPSSCRRSSVPRCPSQDAGIAYSGSNQINDTSKGL